MEYFNHPIKPHQIKISIEKLPSLSDKEKTKEDFTESPPTDQFISQKIMHSVALIAVETAFPGNQKVWPKSLLVAGMTMFSGSIYMLVLDPQRFKAMGPVTPLGGVCLLYTSPSPRDD